jgi:hypothetical protein
MAYDRLRVAPQRLANRGVHQAPRGDLIDIAHPAQAGAAPGAIPAVGCYAFIRGKCRSSLSANSGCWHAPPMSVPATVSLAPGC